MSYPEHDAAGKADKNAISSGNLVSGEEEHNSDVLQVNSSTLAETSENQSSRYKNTPESSPDPPISNSFSDILSGIIGKDSSSATAFSLE